MRSRTSFLVFFKVSFIFWPSHYILQSYLLWRIEMLMFRYGATSRSPLATAPASATDPRVASKPFGVLLTVPLRNNTSPLQFSGHSDHMLQCPALSVLPIVVCTPEYAAFITALGLKWSAPLPPSRKACPKCAWLSPWPDSWSATVSTS